MEYLLLIWRDEKLMSHANEASLKALSKEYLDLTNDIIESGHHRGGAALQPVATATTVRLREGKVMTTDGPFAETREQLAGFYLVEAANLDEAIQIAARIPNARDGSIEVRPVRPVPGQPAKRA